MGAGVGAEAGAGVVLQEGRVARGAIAMSTLKPLRAQAVQLWSWDRRGALGVQTGGLQGWKWREGQVQLRSHLALVGTEQGCWESQVLKNLGS